jgi:hypothetical protein
VAREAGVVKPTALLTITGLMDTWFPGDDEHAKLDKETMMVRKAIPVCPICGGDVVHQSGDYHECIECSWGGKEVQCLTRVVDKTG